MKTEKRRHAEIETVMVNALTSEKQVELNGKKHYDENIYKIKLIKAIEKTRRILLIWIIGGCLLIVSYILSLIGVIK